MEEEAEDDLVVMSTNAEAVSQTSTPTHQDPNTTAPLDKQATTTKQPISPLASSVVKPSRYIPPHESKYKPGWGLDAIDDFPHKPTKQSQQRDIYTDASNTSESNAGTLKRRPRSGPWLFRCPPGCEKCSRQEPRSEKPSEDSPSQERADSNTNTTSNSNSNSNSNTTSNCNTTSKDSSSSSSSSSSPATPSSPSPSASPSPPSPTLSDSLSSTLKISKISSPKESESKPQPQPQPYLAHLMPIDTLNPYIITESRRAARVVHNDSLGKHTLGVIACATLNATGKGRGEWEEVVGFWEDDVVVVDEPVLGVADDDGAEGEEEGSGKGMGRKGRRKLGMTADEVYKQHRRRGCVLEGTTVVVERRWGLWRKRAEGVG